MKLQFDQKFNILACLFLLLSITWLTGCNEKSGSTISEENKKSSCVALYPEPLQMSDLEFHSDSSFELQGEESLAFLFQDWCRRIPANDTVCRCRLNLTELSLVSEVPLPSLNRIYGRQVDPNKNGPVSTDIELEMDANGNFQLPADGLSIIEGSSIALEIPGIENYPGLRLVAGGLCIVENIDGGDDGNL